MTRIALIVALATSGCMNPGSLNSGTAVGNPPDAKIRTEPGAEIALVGAELQGVALVQAPCDLSKSVTEDVFGRIDLLEGGPVVLQRDAPCGLALEFDRIVLDGETTDHGDEVAIRVIGLELRMGRGTGWAREPFASEGHFVLEVGDPSWLQDLRVELAYDDLVIDADDPRAATIAERLTESSGLYADPDGDGVIEQADRDAAVMGGWIVPEREPEFEEEEGE